jgi:hypothetical protein
MQHHDAVSRVVVVSEARPALPLLAGLARLGVPAGLVDPAARTRAAGQLPTRLEAEAADGCDLLLLRGDAAAADLRAAAGWATARRAASGSSARRPTPLVVLQLCVPGAGALGDTAGAPWSDIDIVLGDGEALAAATQADIADPLDAEDAAVRLCDWGAATAVVDLGGDGAVVVRGGRATYLPPFTVDVVDPAGAADCFCAAFVTASLEGFDLFASAGYALAGAAVCVGRPGAAEAMPNRDEVERMAHSVDLRRDLGTAPVEFPR